MGLAGSRFSSAERSPGTSAIGPLRGGRLVEPAEANELLDRIDRDLRDQGGRRITQTVGNVEVISYLLPMNPGQKTARRAYYFIREDQLVASDHVTLAIMP